MHDIPQYPTHDVGRRRLVCDGYFPHPHSTCRVIASAASRRKQTNPKQAICLTQTIRGSYAGEHWDHHDDPIEEEFVYVWKWNREQNRGKAAGKRLSAIFLDLATNTSLSKHPSSS